MKKYFSYFKFLYILIGIVTIATGILAVIYFSNQTQKQRGNTECPEERVYDYADMLSASEESKLREYIENREAKIGADIVVVLLNESLYKKYGVTEDNDSNWQKCIMNYADDFYDTNKYGFDKVHGDGILLVYNWYDDGIVNEKGSWVSTCGSVLDTYSNSMIDRLLDDIYDDIYTDPYAACINFVDRFYSDMMNKGSLGWQIPMWVCLLVAAAAGGIFIFMHLKTSEGKDTTGTTTYVMNGKPDLKLNQDELTNKFVTSRTIETNSGSGGGGGGHVSSGGVSHGGGGRRG